MKTICSFILLLQINFVLSAQDNALFSQHRFKLLNEANGLSNSFINDIEQDTLGLMWIATEEGVFCYQGSSFRKFSADQPSHNFLHNSFVASIYSDQNNNIWAVTNDGVAVYSFRSDVFTRYLPNKISGRFSSMSTDSQGRYYFGAFRQGVLRVKQDSVEQLNLYDQETGINFGEYSILDMVIVDNRLWAIISDLGVISYNIATQKIVFFSASEIIGRDKLMMHDLYVDSFKKIWLCTESSVVVLGISNNQTKIIDKRLEKVLPKDDYLSIHQDFDKKNMWIGSRRNGLYVVKKSNGVSTILHHFQPEYAHNSISHRSISKVFQAKSKVFWLGTHHGAVNLLDPNGEKVRQLTYNFRDSSSLIYPSVWGIAESGQGDIWVGTDGRGLSRLDPHTGVVSNNVFPILDQKSVLSVLNVIEDRLWVGTYSNGAYLFDLTTGKTTQFTTQSEHSDLTVNDIRCFYQLPTGATLIGSNQGGLYSFTEKEGRLKRMPNTEGLDIRAIVVERSNIAWLATYGQGLIKYNMASGEIQKTLWSDDRRLSTTIIFDLYYDGKVIWAATRHNGLIAFDVFNNVLLELGETDQLTGLSILSVQADSAGNIWFTTNYGMYCYLRKTNTIKKFASDDGLQSGHFNHGSLLLSKSGFLAVGGVNGMNLFYPQQLLKNSAPANILLHELNISGKVVNPTNSTIFKDNRSIFLTESIVLGHNENDFSISFSLSNGIVNSGKDLMYRLKGYETNWQHAYKSSNATYTDMRPGRYTFEVRYGNIDAEKQLNILIKTPFWRTPFAYFLYIVTALFVLWILLRVYNRQLILKQKLIFEQKIVEKEKALLQDKLQFYISFSHELKTPLTLIKGPVNDLLKTTKNTLHRKYLNLINKNSDIILKYIKKMLELTKAEMNKTTLSVSLCDIKSIAQQEAATFEYLSKEKGIKFGFYCQNNLEDWVDPEKIQIIMNNLLSNAFKFIGDGKFINFGVFEADGSIIIEVKDHGIGIKKKELKSIFHLFFQVHTRQDYEGSGIGLALCKKFVELHQGEIKVKSKELEGTTFTVKIPKGKEKFEDKSYVEFERQSIPQLDTNDYEKMGYETDDDEAEISNTEKIMLIVDDNEDICFYIQSLFKNEFTIFLSHNGSDACDLSIQHIPDIIICDIMMPDMDGFEFCKRIKSDISTSHIPVIMLSAKDTKNDKIKGYSLGADEYMTKPFVSEILKARVDNLLNNRELLELKFETSNLMEKAKATNKTEVEFVLRCESIVLKMVQSKDVDINDICMELGMSHSTLYKKIKSLTGMSLQLFIRKVKLKHAAYLLEVENNSISELAFALGFSDARYFRKCFKEQFGIAPSEYRINKKEK